MDEINDVNFETENKNKKVIIGIIVFVVLVLGAFWGGNKLKKSSELSYESQVTAPNDTASSIQTPVETTTMCFYHATKVKGGLYDTTMLRVVVTGYDITGEFSNYPAYKDSKIGMFKGTVGQADMTTGERIATVLWDSVAEGKQVTEELLFKFTTTKAVVEYGQMQDKGDGTYIYKDKTKLTASAPLEQISCDSLNETKAKMWQTK